MLPDATPAETLVLIRSALTPRTFRFLELAESSTAQPSRTAMTEWIPHLPPRNVGQAASMTARDPSMRSSMSGSRQPWPLGHTIEGPWPRSPWP
jgi:hypothetical protein